MLEKEGSMFEEKDNQTMENESPVPWQMFRHVIEQVKARMVEY